ncbi:hypothetical protein [Nesterenkonia populi]|uniref:hypothetical protein n=1 Tax=Nesterenkonia populi TaxID=1591087 RepID=UPI0011BEA04B|nr:hypothetical protein [Nesterenkonia populi]
MMSSFGTQGRARQLAARAAAEEAAHPAQTTAAQAESQARLQILIESRAIWSLLFGGMIGLVVGFLVFPGERPALAGNDDMSIQFYGAVVGGVTAGMAFVVGWSLNTRMANLWIGQRPALRQLMDTVSLTVVHSSIAVMASLGIFRVFQEAFIGLTVDHIAGSVLVALVGAVSAYFSFNSGARITAFTLSTILAIFMASGILISTLFAENPYWWHVMFSELGTGQAGTTSFWTFNTTLVVSGVIITTLTAFITRDLHVWADAARAKVGRRLAERRRRAKEGSGKVPLRARVSIRLDGHFWTPRIGIVRICMIGMGVCLAGVGLIPISLHHDGHVVATAGFALFFLVLLLGMPYWLPGFPRSFYLFSYIEAAALIFSFVLWIPLDYWNLTSMELVAAAILFSWLVVFIRNIAAQVERVRTVG